MASIEHVSVVVQDDFVARQTRAKPIPALAELIWNSLDADATRVDVELVYGGLIGGLSQIVVQDDGEGFSREDARGLFGNLGGSWKRMTRRTRRGDRMIHGQEGRGRYKAFSLGGLATWKVCYAAPDGTRAFEIRIAENDLTDVVITPDEPAPGRRTGVIVAIDNLRREFRSFETDEGFQELAEIFALYLKSYKAVSISVAGNRIDPEKAIRSEAGMKLPPIVAADGSSHDAELQVIEWRADTKRILYLCSKNGFPLDQFETKFHVPGFSFSAYLRSSYVEQLQNESRLGLADLDPPLAGAIERARSEIKDYFRNRAAEKARTVVEVWKADEVYPYVGEPQSTVEKAERQVFDIVAVHVQELAPEIGVTSAMARALHLRMLRNAIERGPEELQLILKEVLDLPVRQQKELAALLQETSLTAIITAAKTVADRLKFIAALESIVFDPETKGRLKERSQLHKMLAENTWVFGEEYNLWVNDKDLRNVLVRHKSLLDPAVEIDDPVKVSGQKRAIVDLMFSRATRRHRANDIEHLVVELKAPRVKIGADEMNQIKKYAQAVRADERFRTVKGIRWHFWIVSNDYDEMARYEIEGGPDPERRYIARTGDHTVGIKTWGEIIEENRARLQFFQEQMQHTVSESQAVEHLQEKYSRFLEGVIRSDVDGEAAAGLADAEDLDAAYGPENVGIIETSPGPDHEPNENSSAAPSQ